MGKDFWVENEVVVLDDYDAGPSYRLERNAHEPEILNVYRRPSSRDEEGTPERLVGHVARIAGKPFYSHYSETFADDLHRVAWAYFCNATSPPSP